MKLHKDKVETKPPFWSWILFNPKAFQVLFTMSIVMGLLVSVGLITCSFVFNWSMEYKIIWCAIGGFNIYNCIKFLKGVQYMGSTTVNEMVYGDRFKPKEDKKHGNNK